MKIPTREEIEAYKKEKNLELVDVDDFINYFDSVGWTVGRSKPMKDYKAAMRTWNARQEKFDKRDEEVFKVKTAPPQYNRFGERPYTKEELERIERRLLRSSLADLELEEIR